MTARHYGFPMHVWHVMAARPRLLVGMCCGILAAFLLPGSLDPATRAIVAWDIGVIVFLIGSAVLFLTEAGDRMAEDAAAQEEGEWTVFWLTVAAVAFSFAAIIEEFSNINTHPPNEKYWHFALVAVTLLSSWLMTHTTFAFRYAHEYYQTDADEAGINGGLEFPDEKYPDYLDFFYFALVIGMTFQVADVGISSRTLRRLATAHGLLSFLFNTIILALTINLTAGLL